MLGDSVTRPSSIANSRISRPVSPHCLSFAVTASIAVSFSQFACAVLLPRCTLLSAIFLSLFPFLPLPFYQSLVPFSRGSSFSLSAFFSLLRRSPCKMFHFGENYFRPSRFHGVFVLLIPFLSTKPFWTEALLRIHVCGVWRFPLIRSPFPRHAPGVPLFRNVSAYGIFRSA